MDYLFSFRGRINRAKIWLFFLILVIAYIVFGLVLNVAFGASLISFLMMLGTRPAALFAGGAVALPLILFGLFYALMFYIGLAVSAKRLHDRNKSATWLLVFIVLPLILNIVGAIVAPTDLSTGVPNTNPIKIVLSLASVAISLWAFVELYCLRGTTGDNQYGPDPLSPRA